jgi:hypothetical protein
MVRRGLTRAAAIIAAALPILSLTTVARADVVTNTLALAGQTSVVADGTSTATVGYTVQNTNRNNDAYPDPQNSCNPADGTAATLQVVVPSGVTVSPATAVVSGCDVPQSFTFRASAAGRYPVTVTVTDPGGGTYATAPAAFTLVATAPVVVNRPPTVAVTGVAAGAAYEFGTVPAAGCTVTDPEDGSSSFPATLSALTGPRAAAGLGSRTATCSYTDRGQLTASAEAAYTVVDRTAPAVSVTEDLALEATGPSTRVEFSATATDAVDGTVPATCAPSSGAGFAVGATTVTCTATDQAGNTGSAAFAVAVTDRTAPTVVVPPSTTAAATSAAGAPVTYGPVSAEDLVDGALAATCDRASGEVFPLGATAVTCTATDAAGNTGSATFTVTVQDRAAPVVTVPANVVAEATSPAGAVVEHPGATAVDDVDGPVAVTCDVASGATYQLGDTTVTCSATDAAGNTGSSSFTVTVRDTTAPALTVPRVPVTVEATSGLGAVADFAVSAVDLVDGDVTVACSAASGDQFPLGSTTVTCSAADARANAARETFVVSVVDTTAPALAAPADVTAEATGPDGARVSYLVADARDTVDGPVTPVCSPAAGGTFPLGTTTVECTATDRAGNAATVSATVTVRDTTAPVVAVPANLAVEATGPDGATVPYGTVTASDAVDGTVEATCDPVSGTVFALGTTPVECSVRDAAGNTGSGSFLVTVQDTTAPVVTVPAPLVLEATSAAGAVAAWSVSALDGVEGDLPVTCDRESGSSFALGSTTVTCRAEDGSGNEGTNTFPVTVRDTTAPVVGVGGPVRVLAATAEGAPVQYARVTGTDLVDGVLDAACDRPSGGVFPLGTTTVTCTATDVAGNTGTATFTVTVAVDWSGVLAPVSLDGRSAFKQGSTVPVRFRLTGVSAGTTDLPATLTYVRTGGTGSGTAVAAVPTNGRDRGNVFRYDASGGQYVLNLDTKLMAAGTYELRIDLGDGVRHAVTVVLR